MNLSGSKKTLALAGALCGVVAVILAVMGNPANMAICIACFIIAQRGFFCNTQKHKKQKVQPAFAGFFHKIGKKQKIAFEREVTQNE